MWEFLQELGGKMMSALGRLDNTQWAIFSICAILVGFLCLRGFGSRKYY